MSKLNIALLVICAVIAVCYGNDKFPVTRAEEVENVDGLEAYSGQYPWYVIITSFVNTNILAEICGGTILSSRWIMTEAYCAEVATSFHVYFGETSYSMNFDPEEAIISNRGIVHPLFNNPTRLANNIALIKLPTDIELGSLTVRAITLPWDIVEDLTLIQTNMVGFINLGPVYHKRWNNLQVISDEECSNMTTPDATALCTLGTSFNELQTPCWLYVGPALAYYRNGTWTQIGIGNFQSCRSDVPSRFTRVSLFLDWIAAVTGISG